MEKLVLDGRQQLIDSNKAQHETTQDDQASTVSSSEFEQPKMLLLCSCWEVR